MATAVCCTPAAESRSQKRVAASGRREWERESRDQRPASLAGDAMAGAGNGEREREESNVRLKEE